MDNHSKVIELVPTNSESYCDRGELKYFSEDYQRAIDDYSKALELTTYETDKKEILELH